MHSMDAATPAAKDDSSAGRTPSVAENPYTIPMIIPRMFPATVQPMIISSARTRLPESATAKPANSTISNSGHGADSSIEESIETGYPILNDYGGTRRKMV